MAALAWVDEVRVGETGSPRGRHLELVQGDLRARRCKKLAGRRSRRKTTRATFLWRRALVLGALAGLGILAWDATAGILAPANAAPTKAAPALSHVYVARSGDTIWQIAERFSRGGDPRPLVATLEAEIGGGTLQPGQVLTVP